MTTDTHTHSWFVYFPEISSSKTAERKEEKKVCLVFDATCTVITLNFLWPIYRTEFCTCWLSFVLFGSLYDWQPKWLQVKLSRLYFTGVAFSLFFLGGGWKLIYLFVVEGGGGDFSHPTGWLGRCVTENGQSENTK